jgi:hypothetical protein
LKVTQGNATARIGNYSWVENGTQKKAMIKIHNGTKNTFVVDSNGNTTIDGSITTKSGSIAGWSIHEGYICKGDIGKGNAVFLCSTPCKEWGIHGVNDNE